MALTFTGSGGLFTRLGRIFALLYQTHTFTVGNGVGILSNQYALAEADLGTNYDVIALLPSAEVAARSAITSAQQASIKAAAVAMLNKQVIADTKLPSNSDLSITIPEVIRQMTSAGASVKKCTVSGSASAASGNAGNGTVVISVLRPDGLSQANLFAETGSLKCTSDSQTGGATLGREVFTYQGNPAVDPMSDAWPAGSGAITTFNSIDSLESAGANVLTNSSWETLNSKSDGWTGWKIDTGTYNTDLTTDATQVYRGVKSLKIVGGSTSTAFHQDFNNTTDGTAANLKPLTEYAVIIRHKVDVNPAAGVLTIDLTDQNNTVLADAQSANNTKAITLSSVTTTFSATTTTFRTPAVVPVSGYRLRVRITTALSSGTNLFIDDLAMAEMSSMYRGGPLVTVFAGSNKWVQNDSYTMTFANNRGGASVGGNFQAYFDRMFGMRDMGLLLPEASSPTIADSLISSTS